MTCKRSKVKSSIKYKKKEYGKSIFLAVSPLSGLNIRRKKVSWQKLEDPAHQGFLHSGEKPNKDSFTVHSWHKLEESQANVISVTIHPLG